MAGSEEISLTESEQQMTEGLRHLWTWSPTAKTVDPNNSLAINDTFPPRSFFCCRCRCGVVDADGDGLVHVDDVVRNFRPHAHPEVVDGSREEEDVRREFLESFSGKTWRG